MGYTHYWGDSKSPAYPTFTPDQWKQVCGAVRQAINVARDEYHLKVQADSDIDEPPEINSESISFNGIGDDGHETFALNRQAEDWNFCKTARKPYDALVVATLIIANRANPHFRWRSDGDPDDHEKGLILAKKAWPDILLTGCDYSW